MIFIVIDSEKSFLIWRLSSEPGRESSEFISSILVFSRRNAFVESQSILKSSLECILFACDCFRLCGVYIILYFLPFRHEKILFLKTYRGGKRGRCWQKQGLPLGELGYVAVLLCILPYSVLQPMPRGGHQPIPTRKERLLAQKVSLLSQDTKVNSGEPRIWTEDYRMLKLSSFPQTHVVSTPDFTGPHFLMHSPNLPCHSLS